MSKNQNEEPTPLVKGIALFITLLIFLPLYGMCLASCPSEEDMEEMLERERRTGSMINRDIDGDGEVDEDYLRYYFD